MLDLDKRGEKLIQKHGLCTCDTSRQDAALRPLGDQQHPPAGVAHHHRHPLPRGVKLQHKQLPVLPHLHKPTIAGMTMVNVSI